MQISSSQLKVAKVLHEDDDFLTLEVVKNEQRELQLDPDGTDRFFTVIFVHKVEDHVEVWVPWENG